MLEIGTTSFELDITPLGEVSLKAYATGLFKQIDEQASTLLPLLDYGLELDLEEGSLRGKSLILATAASLYLGIGQYGSFVQGLREIRNGARALSLWTTEHVPHSLGCTAEVIRTRRSGGGVVTKLARLFNEVQHHRLSPEQALERALPLFGGGTDSPLGLRDDLEAALRVVGNEPRQLDFDFGAWKDGPDSGEPEPPRRQRHSSDRPAALPAERLRVEIRRESRTGKPIMRVIHL